MNAFLSHNKQDFLGKVMEKPEHKGFQGRNFLPKMLLYRKSGKQAGRSQEFPLIIVLQGRGYKKKRLLYRNSPIVPDFRTNYPRGLSTFPPVDKSPQRSIHLDHPCFQTYNAFINCRHFAAISSPHPFSRLMFCSSRYSPE